MPDFSTSYRILRQDGSSLRTLAAYREADGYKALESTLRQQTPDQIVQQVSAAKLRGRGGAGRLTGEKWRIVQQSDDTRKYVICNAYDADSRSYIARTLL